MSNYLWGFEMYYTYMLRCRNDSIYTGITNDLKKRFEKHISGKGAKYTRSHKPLKIIAVFESDDKSSACRLEYRIKRLSRMQKEIIVEKKNLDILQDKFDTEKYRYIEGDTVGGYL